MLESGVGAFGIRFAAGGDLYPGKIKALMKGSGTRDIRNEAAVATENEERWPVRTQLEPLTVRPVAWSLAEHLGIFDH